MKPARLCISNRDGEQPRPYESCAHPMPYGHGHETAAQRYTATRIQAGYEPERSVSHSQLCIACKAITLKSLQTFSNLQK
uniref:Uncharacterized protein n=1 Tax=Monopterus albus TaxID=43700 RepID=A0A3Q3QBM8_MONAL